MPRIRRHRTPFVCLALVAFLACGDTSDERYHETEPSTRATTSRESPVAALSSSAVEGFARAIDVRPFAFPADHGPHPDFAVEWWYLTGNLRAENGDPFGYQLTFFRRAITPPATNEVTRPSAWATGQVYLAHFALTDVARKDFFASERTARGAMGLAGAQAEPFQVWLEDWSIRAVSDGSNGSDANAFPVRVRAVSDTHAIDLTLGVDKPPALNGDRGLSAKGSAPGNASYYYTMPRLGSRGTVTVGNRSYSVEGTSWLDREWSTSLLEEAQIGWDWFAVQLDDGRDLMMFQLRRDDGATEPANHGTLIDRDGGTRHLAVDDFTIGVLDTWRSPNSIRYPSRWRLTVPSASLELIVTPRIANQELDLSFRYWEGAVAVQGTSGGETVTGAGYVELVGYEPDDS